MVIDFSTLEKNPYKLLFDLKEAFRPQKTRAGYIMVVGKGDFELHDYGCGLYYVDCEVVGYGKGMDANATEPVNYCVLFTVGCADDGSWQAWSRYMSKEKCEALVERIKTEVFDEEILTTMPHAVELNTLLEPYGLFGEFQP